MTPSGIDPVSCVRRIWPVVVSIVWIWPVSRTGRVQPLAAET
jgi:hypothetical protein